MIVPIDEQKYIDAGIDYLGGDDVSTFTLAPERPEDRPRVVKVAVTDEGLHFFPERSSGHRRVLALLGFAVE